MNVTARSVALTWSPSKTLDSNRFYIVKYKPKNSKREGFLGSKRTKDTQALVSGLEPYTEYEFRVLTGTDVGVGELSQPIEITTAKALPESASKHVQSKPSNSTKTDSQKRIGNMKQTYLILQEKRPTPKHKVESAEALSPPLPSPPKSNKEDLGELPMASYPPPSPLKEAVEKEKTTVVRKRLCELFGEFDGFQKRMRTLNYEPGSFWHDPKKPYGSVRGIPTGNGYETEPRSSPRTDNGQGHAQWTRSSYQP